MMTYIVGTNVLQPNPAAFSFCRVEEENGVDKLFGVIVPNHPWPPWVT